MGTQRVLWAAAPAGTDEKICRISFTNVKGPFQAPWIIWVTRLISPRLR